MFKIILILTLIVAPAHAAKLGEDGLHKQPWFTITFKDLSEDMAAAKEHGIVPFELVVVNLYPFESTLARGADFATCIENIDIGGPAMLRSAAKNHAFVDGNKRTAWTVMRLFLGLNGGKLDYDKFEAVKFVEGVAGGTTDYDGARDWIAGRLK